MELVYLWVEEYKNIYKQGFNFSPRFECSFDGENLTIDDKSKDYVSIFPDNINITAIVGENGSGKSSIIDILQECVENNLDTQYILVFKDDNNELKYISKKTIVSDLQQGIYKELAQNTCIYNKNDHIAFQFRDYHVVNIDKQAIVNILITKCDNPEFKISTFMYLPTSLEIKLKDSETLIKENINFFNPLDREKIKQIFTSITDPYHQYLFITYGREQGINSSIDILTNKKKLKSTVRNPQSEYNYYAYFTELENEEIFHIKELTEEAKNIYISEGSYFHFFHFDMIDERGRRFNHLSHGEQMIFGQLLNIYFYSNFKSSLIFLFDEPEISLHTNWQKNYIKELHALLKRLKKTYHFIFTSHSPFLLSDVPKENVIFLQKDEITGDCKNVTKKIDIKTFGANIHTLLSHGFFMKDGLMGEFAKGRINEAIKYLNQKTLTEKEIEYCENIISIVGEPILKRQLQRMLDCKRLSEVEQIKKQIEKLQDELAKKEDKKND